MPIYGSTRRFTCQTVTRFGTKYDLLYITDKKLQIVFVAVIVIA
jgi:hypothetical protein